MRLRGRVAFVTGGASGIGAATARQLAAVIAFLASDDAAYMTGETVAVSGGLSLH